MIPCRAEIRIPMPFMNEAVMQAICSSRSGKRWCVAMDGLRYQTDSFDKLFTFRDDEAPNGEFPDLESALIALGVPFDRKSAGAEGIENGPETRHYRPASYRVEIQSPVFSSRPADFGGVLPSKPVDCTVIETPGGEPVILADDLRKAVQFFRKNRDIVQWREKFEARLNEMVGEALVGETSPLEDWANGKIVPVNDIDRMKIGNEQGR